MSTDLIKKIMLEKKRSEKENLSVYGFFSENTKGRFRKEEADIRMSFMRDRDRIIHSNSFRRLKDKAQVFLLSKNDMVRTRLTHTLEVSQISRTISYALNLNETLTEAIALGHDLGHAPFGHIGETALKELSQEWFGNDGADLEEIDFLNTGQEWVFTKLKNFRHNVQSLRIVDFLEKKGQGLNLTHEVRDGILKHSKWGKKLTEENNRYKPQTLEGQVVRLVDRIAYVNHDLEDALRSKLIKEEEIPTNILKGLGHTHSERIHKAVIDVIIHSYEKETLCLSDEISFLIDELYTFLDHKVYQIINTKEGEKARDIIKRLASYYKEHPKALFEKTEDIAYPESISLEQKIIDYICNMTDHFILAEYKNIFLPKSFEFSF